jgi:hypothetical protein
VTRPRVSVGRWLAAALLTGSLLVPAMSSAEEPAGTLPAGAPRPADERYPPRAIKAGAISGLVVGTLVGVGYGLLITAIIEIDDDDLSWQEGGVITGILGLGGAASGTLLGAWAGSLFPKEPKDGLPRGTRLVGSFAVSGGGATFLGNDFAEGGFIGRATLYSHFEPWLAVGAETGILTGAPHSWRLAGGVRIDPFRPDRIARPYLAGSIGGNFWESGENLLSADAGIGVEHPYDNGRSAVGLEGRYHWNLQNAVAPGTYEYASLALTWRNDW